MSEVRQAQLGKRCEALQKRLRAGAILHCEADQTEEGAVNDGRRWFLEPGGRKAGPKTASKLARSGLLRSSGGLLDGDAQSFEAIEPERLTIVRSA